MFNSIHHVKNINAIGSNTLIEHLGIEVMEVGHDYIKGKMPVDNRTKQPYGLLHGGASVVLAETLGSYGSNFILDNTKYYAVGLAINANHIKSVSDGFVIGIATAIHIGKTTHIWEIKITNEKDELICGSRLTMAVIEVNKHKV